MPPKRVLKTLSIEEKYKLLKDIKSGIRNKDVAEKYGIPKNTVSTIVKNEKSILEAMENRTSCSKIKRLKKGMYEDLDKAVFDWFTSARAQNLPVSGAIVKQKALGFSNRLGNCPNFKASTGWLDNWKRRYVHMHISYG